MTRDDVTAGGSLTLGSVLACVILIQSAWLAWFDIHRDTRGGGPGHLVVGPLRTTMSGYTSARVAYDPPPGTPQPSAEAVERPADRIERRWSHPMRVAPLAVPPLLGLLLLLLAPFGRATRRACGLVAIAVMATLLVSWPYLSLADGGRSRPRIELLLPLAAAALLAWAALDARRPVSRRRD